MEKFKGTPGPWFVNNFANSTPDKPHHWITASEDGGCKDDRYMSVSGAIDIHDARLVAAAPELLEALQDLDGYFCAFTPLEKNASIKAKAAIAKALGNSINETDPITQSTESEANNDN